MSENLNADELASLLNTLEEEQKEDPSENLILSAENEILDSLTRTKRITPIKPLETSGKPKEEPVKTRLEYIPESHRIIKKPKQSKGVVYLKLNYNFFEFNNEGVPFVNLFGKVKKQIDERGFMFIRPPVFLLIGTNKTDYNTCLLSKKKNGKYKAVKGYRSEEYRHFGDMLHASLRDYYRIPKNNSELSFLVEDALRIPTIDILNSSRMICNLESNLGTIS